jgi:hypothetical protein
MATQQPPLPLFGRRVCALRPLLRGTSGALSAAKPCTTEANSAPDAKQQREGARKASWRTDTCCDFPSPKNFQGEKNVRVGAQVHTHAVCGVRYFTHAPSVPHTP